jgi:hypothetical protein
MFEIKDYTADMIQGEIENGMPDLDLMSLLSSGRIKVRISSLPIPRGIVTILEVAFQNM